MCRIRAHDTSGPEAVPRWITDDLSELLVRGAAELICDRTRRTRTHRQSRIHLSEGIVAEIKTVAAVSTTHLSTATAGSAELLLGLPLTLLAL